MAEYIDREALLDKRRKVTEYDEAGFAMNYQAVPVEDIEAIPATDVAEVVRCEKCKRCELRYPAKAIGEEAIEGYWCHSNQKYVTPNDFCSCGERKGGVEK